MSAVMEQSKTMSDGQDSKSEGVVGIPATGPHCIEVRECGTWDTFDIVPDFETALQLASSICDETTDERVRISTPDLRIL